MPPRLVLGLGTGRCGTLSLAQVLSRQPETIVSHERRPLLPWQIDPSPELIRRRLETLRSANPDAALIGDVALFYLPYLESALAVEPSLKAIVLRRPREETVDSFTRWLDGRPGVRIHHWADSPPDGYYHHPDWTRIFPKNGLADRAAAIGRYWDDYYREAERLARLHPSNIRIFETDEALNTPGGLRDLLRFAGIPDERQMLEVGTRIHEGPRPDSRSRRDDDGSLDPRRCAVLVPYGGSILPACEEGLRGLERKGYAVRRVAGFSAIDQGRSQMATDALDAGFEETLWIDSDVGFEPEAVDRLRSHGEPVICGICPQKGRKAVACHVLPGTTEIVFGKAGGLLELRYAGTGFLLVRRQVYQDLQNKLELPVCNERFGRPLLPYYQPLLLDEPDGSRWYLAEDYAFCERARRCGYRILADTTLRLWHYGSVGYGWEDAGTDRARYGSFTLKLGERRSSGG